MTKQADAIVDNMMAGCDHASAVKANSVDVVMDFVNGVNQVNHFFEVAKFRSAEFCLRVVQIFR